MHAFSKFHKSTNFLDPVLGVWLGSRLNVIEEILDFKRDFARFECWQSEFFIAVADNGDWCNGGGGSYAKNIL